MTYDVFDLTEHTQLSIRGTTGTHPDSKYVFGVHIGTEEIHAEEQGFTPEFTAYDDVDWNRAVEMAKWILEWDGRFNADAPEDDRDHGTGPFFQGLYNATEEL